MLDYFFVPGDTEDGEKLLQEKKIQAKDETRPYVVVDVGSPYGIVSVLFPPDENLEDKQLTYNQLIQLMRDKKIVPVQLGMDWRFISWDEARQLFDSLFDKYLYENFNILATDKVNKDDNH